MPTHIHLCLLSDQRVPNLMSIMALKPDRIALVETEAMRRKHIHEDLIEALKLAGKEFDYSQRAISCDLQEPDDLHAAEAAFDSLIKQHPGVQWSVNLTGGTKIMSIAAHKVFDAISASLYYVEIGQPDQIQCLNDGKKFICDHRLSLEQFLRCYGFFASPQTSPNGVQHQDFLSLARAIALDADALVIGNLPARGWEYLRRGKFVAVPGQIVLKTAPLVESFDREAQRRASTASPLSPLAFDGAHSLVGPIDRFTGELLTGGWLETLLFGLLKKNAEALGIWDVRLGLHFRPASTTPSTSTFDNELDVAFMHAHKLCSIECKTGEQEHDPDVGALYKIEAVLGQLRALLRSAILASTSDNVYRKDASTGHILEGEVKTSLLERAQLNHWTIIDRVKIRQLAAAETADEEIRLLRQCLNIFGEENRKP